MNKTLKKVLSFVLAIAMVITSITVSNKAVKADGNLVKMESTSNSIMGISQANTEAWVSSDVMGTIIRDSHEFKSFFVAGPGDVGGKHDGWGRITETHPLAGIDVLAIPFVFSDIASMSISAMDNKEQVTELVNTNNESEPVEKMAMWNGDCTAIPASHFDIGDNETGVFTLIVTRNGGEKVSFDITIKKYHKSSKLELKGTNYDKVLDSDGPTFTWNEIEGAVKYRVTCTDNESGYVYKNEEVTANKIYFWTSDIMDGKEGTYTIKVVAIDANGKDMVPEEGDTVSISGCKKYYKAPETADRTETGIAQSGYTSAEDVTDWVKLNGEASNGNTAWISQSVVSKFGAVECRGFNPNTKYHVAGTAFEGNKTSCFAFVASGGGPTAIVINGTRYLNSTTNTLVYVGSDCVYINETLISEAGNYIITTEGNDKIGTFVLQVRGAAQPDSTEKVADTSIDPETITEWIQLNGTSVNGSVVYASSVEAMGNGGLRGFYNDSNPDWNRGDTNFKELPVFGFVTTGEYATALIINDTKYTDATNKKNTKVFIGKDCVYINQSLVEAAEGETKYFTITAVGTKVQPFVIKVVGATPKTKYTVKVDNNEPTMVEEGSTYTLPDTSVNGYLCDGKAYKAGSEVTVNSDMEFTSIGDISISVATGAGIRYTVAENAGLRFKATVVASDILLNSSVIETGMLITDYGFYTNSNKAPEVEGNEYTVINVVNSGWYNNVAGTYCGSIVGIGESNWIRDFVGRAYVTIKYEGGETKTIYSNMTGNRSVQYVASQFKVSDAYEGLNSAYKTIIDAYAATTK